MMRFLRLFSFAGRDGQGTFAYIAAGFAAVLAALWGLGWAGILPDSFAQGQELFWFGIILATVPAVASIMRRMNDTVFPGGLIIAAPVALGLSYFLPVVAGLDWAGPVFFWLSMAFFAALAVGLCWPSKPTVEQGVQVTGGSHAH